MAQISAFKGVRYNTEKAGKIETLVCPPYDIISEKQRQDLLNTNPYNMIRLELPKGDNPYQDASSILNEWLEEEILVRDMDEAIYIYEEEFLEKVDTGKQNSLKGIICTVKVEDFSAGVVLPHEQTLSKAKEDRLNLMKTCASNFSQIYSLYIDEKHSTLSVIDNISATTKPRYEFSDGLVTHRLWVINDKVTIDTLLTQFAARKLYIADGHHRYETAINYRNYCRENNITNPNSEYVMMMLVDMAHPGLVVFPTHRLIKGVEKFNESEVLAKCEEYFTVETKSDINTAKDVLENLYNAGKKAFCYYNGGDNWTLLTLKSLDIMNEILDGCSEAYKQLDVNVLHLLVLEKLFGIDKENMANQKNLTYTRSFDEAVESAQSGESQCVFIINPTRVGEIGEVAANGEKMPQKSTYFYPKLTTGLVLNKF